MADTKLFSRLKRLFSTDVLLRSTGGQIKAIDVDKIQQTGELATNTIIDRFNKAYTNAPSSLYASQQNYSYQTLRPTLYSEYDAMDTDAIIASALDIISDESTLKNDMGEVLQIRSKDENIQKVLYNLFYDVLNIEFNLWTWIRDMNKYGDFFLKLEIAEKYGVYNVIPYTAYHMERLEGNDPTNPTKVQFRYDPEGVAASSYGYYSTPGSDSNTKGIILENYEVAHFRLLSDMNFLPYGRCVEKSSKIYTKNSIKEIQNIIPGDKVWTFNKKLNKYELANVLAVKNSGVKELYSVNTAHNELKCSSNHPILILDKKSGDLYYEQVENLKEGDFLCSYGGDLKISQFDSQLSVKFEKINKIIKVNSNETYDIQVDRNSNFIANGIVVHNSYLEPSRKIFKQYTLLEDSMLIHRVVRAPEKRIFYLNVGNLPPNEIDGFMEKTITKLKRTPFVDEQTGDYNLKYNIQNLMEDYYIPMRGNDSTTKIENLNGLQWDGIKDVEYMRDKLFAALKIPRAFMGYTENLEGKSTLASQDVRFARTVERIQRIVISELYKIAIIHLYVQGFKDDSLSNFELSLTTPSIIYDQEKVELLKSKMDLASSIIENKLFPTDWIYENIFQISEENYDEYRDLLIQDSKRDFRLNQISNEGNDPSQTGRSYGTPHDLASLYGRGRYKNNSTPEGEDEEEEQGRPIESHTKINTQQDNFGRDRLGKEGSKPNSPLSETKDENNKINKSYYLKNKNLLKTIPYLKKHIVFESDKAKEHLLDESNLKE